MASTSGVSTTEPEYSTAVEPSVSRSLGSVDTFSDDEVSRQGYGVRRDTGKSVWVEKGTSNPPRSFRDVVNGKNPPRKDPFHNHRELEGVECLLHGSMAERGRVKLDREDWIEPPEDRKFPLMGRFAGKFPGMRIIDELAKTWGVWYNLDEHHNGHVMFWFKTEEDRDVVLKKGPFAVYGKRLFLEPPTKEFTEVYDDYRFRPTWIRLPSLPKPCWNTGALSKIAAAIGEPIYMDHSTLEARKMGFARVLVDVDCSLEPLEHIAIEVPDGSMIEQRIYYQNWVPFCTRCGSGRHITEKCPLTRVESNLRERTVAAVNGNESVAVEEAALGTTGETEVVVGNVEVIAENRADETVPVVTEDTVIDMGVQDIGQPFGTPQVEIPLPPPPLEGGDEAVSDKDEIALSKSARRKARKARRRADAAMNSPCNLETVDEIEPALLATVEQDLVVSLPIEPSRVVAGARRRSPQSKKQKNSTRTTLPLGIYKVAGGGGRRAPTFVAQC